MADRLTVDGNLVLSGSDINGGLGLHSAQVAGMVVMEDTRLTAGQGPTGRALQAPGIHVGAAVFARSARIDGVVFMQGSVIRADLDFRNTEIARARNEQGDSHALVIDNCSIGDDLRIDDAKIEGVGAVGARIGGSLNLDGSNISPGTEGNALTLDHAVISRALFMRRGFTASGHVKMSAADVATLALDLESWPADSRVNLTDAIIRGTEPPVSARQSHTSPSGDRFDGLRPWLDWIDRYADPAPMSVFEQFATQCQSAGDDVTARRLRYAAEVRRTQQEGPLGKIWGTLLDVTIGYGYRPQLAMLWLGLYALAGCSFYSGHPLTPVKADEALTWDPFLYTVDVLAPVVDLGYANAYQTAGCTKAMMITLTIAGWFLVAAVIAGASRIFSKK